MSLSPTKGASGAPLNLGALVARVDLFALVSRYSGPGKYSGRSASYSCPNPAHFDAHPSFQVTTNKAGKQVAQCFSQCEWHGDALDLVKWIENLDTKEAAQWLRRFLGEPETISFSKKESSTPKNSAPTIPPKYTAKTAKPSAEREARFMARHLLWRMWPAEVVEEFALEVVLDSAGECRVRHPFFAYVSPGEWRLVYWQDRGTSKSPQKWLSPYGMSPALFNLKSLEANGLEAVVICEGPADTISASLVLKGCSRVAVIGVPGASAWRAEWAELVSGLRVVIAADNDEAGRKLEQKISASIGREVSLLRLEDKYNDLTDCYQSGGAESLRLLILAALGQEPETEARTLEASIELLLQYFPEASQVESETV